MAAEKIRDLCRRVIEAAPGEEFLAAIVTLYEALQIEMIEAARDLGDPSALK